MGRERLGVRHVVLIERLVRAAAARWLRGACVDLEDRPDIG
jgi:hypothetical protein